MREAVALAIEALSWMEHAGLSERAAFARAAKQLRISKTDQLRIAQMLVLETNRRRNSIDYLLERLVDGTDLYSLEYGLLSFLRLFAYWTKFRSVADERVVQILRAARSALGWRDLHQIELLFGRILAADPTEISAGTSPDETLALRMFHPTWFAAASTILLGRSSALELMRRNLSPAHSYLRINALRGDEHAFLKEIEKSGARVTPVDGLPLTFSVISSRRPITATEAYRHGTITFQDKASILAGLVAAPRPGDIVLDLCAAPGAKTAHLAGLMQNKGTIYAIDKSATRMSLWRREMSRLGVEIANPVLADATEPLPVNLEADLVLLDPPCSNTGTFWKTPAAKWKVTPGTVRKLASIQSEMLRNASSHVRPGGIIVYSTCSILIEENEQVVNQFLRVNPDFEAVDSTPRIGFRGFCGLDSGQRLYPHVHESNGHFLVKMRRNS